MHTSLLKLVKNPDGYMQVAHKKHPLYTDAGAKGLGLFGDKSWATRTAGFFDAWYVVAPTGKLVKRYR